jgi:hypothetical protein
MHVVLLSTTLASLDALVRRMRSRRHAIVRRFHVRE